MSKELDKLKKKRQKISERICAVEEAEKNERNKALIGKCYKYKNSYSCHETKSDYWWKYFKITGSYEGEPSCDSFERESLYGNVNIARENFFDGSDCIEISSEEYDKAWNDLLYKISGMNK